MNNNNSISFAGLLRRLVVITCILLNIFNDFIDVGYCFKVFFVIRFLIFIIRGGVDIVVVLRGLFNVLRLYS